VSIASAFVVLASSLVSAKEQVVSTP